MSNIHINTEEGTIEYEHLTGEIDWEGNVSITVTLIRDDPIEVGSLGYLQALVEDALYISSIVTPAGAVSFEYTDDDDGFTMTFPLQTFFTGLMKMMIDKKKEEETGK